MDDATEMVTRRQRELDAEATRVSPEVAERNAAGKAYMQDYRRRLADRKAAEQAQRDAAFEASIATVRRVKMLEWLVAHPGQGESDFERIWPHVRELLKLDGRDAAVEREIAAQRRRHGA
jgi:hypothetical protein